MSDITANETTYALLKADLGHHQEPPAAVANLMKSLIATAEKQISLRCVSLDTSKVEDCQFVASWAAWLYRKRDSGAALPDMLREELRARQIAQMTKVETEEDAAE